MEPSSGHAAPAETVASGHDSEQLQEAMVQSQPACALVAAPKNKGGRPRKNKMEADPKQKSLVFTPSQHCVLPEELAGTDDIDGPALGTAASAAASSSGSQAPVAAGPKPKKKRDGQQGKRKSWVNKDNNPIQKGLKTGSAVDRTRGLQTLRLISSILGVPNALARAKKLAQHVKTSDGRFRR